LDRGKNDERGAMNAGQAVVDLDRTDETGDKFPISTKAGP
jgi:hypothetical protein